MYPLRFTVPFQFFSSSSSSSSSSVLTLCINDDRLTSNRHSYSLMSVSFTVGTGSLNTDKVTGAWFWPPTPIKLRGKCGPSWTALLWTSHTCDRYFVSLRICGVLWCHFIRDWLKPYVIQYQGCQSGFKPNSRNLAFLKLGWHHKIYLTFWLFLGTFTCFCTKMTYHHFSKSFSCKNFFFVSYIWQHNQGPLLQFVSDFRRSFDVVYNHINLPCQVYFLYVITCCGETVTPSAVFINHLLSTAMAMLSKKWKTSYNSNHKYRSKWEETFEWVQKAADGSEEAYWKLFPYNILQRISNLSNHEKWEKHKRRTPLQGQTRLNVRKTP